MTDPRSNTSPQRIILNGTPVNSRQGTVDLNRYTQSPDDIKQKQAEKHCAPILRWDRSLWLTSLHFTGTQDDQNHADDDAKQQAMDALVQSWKERLSLISVIVSVPVYLCCS